VSGSVVSVGAGYTGSINAGAPMEMNVWPYFLISGRDALGNGCRYEGLAWFDISFFIE
jgi:hypothetical protein